MEIGEMRETITGTAVERLNLPAIQIAKLPPLRLFAMPAAIIGLLALIGLPLGYVITSAFFSDPFVPADGFTLDHVKRVLTSARIWNSAGQTLLMSAVVGGLATSIGAALAWIVTRFSLPMPRFLEAVAIAPLFLSPLVTAIAWMAIAAPRSGLANDLLADLGFPEWAVLDVTSLAGICLVMVSHYIPYSFLFMAGSLRNADASLEEASYLCGRGVIYTAVCITLPLMRSAALSSFLFIVILAAGEFSVPAILGAGGKFEPLSVHLYGAIHGYPADFGGASAIAMLMIGISLIAFYFYRRSVASSRRYVTVTGRGGMDQQIDPGRWRGPMLAVFALYGLLTVVLPYAALVLISLIRFRVGDLSDVVFTLDNFTRVWSSAGARAAIGNSLVLAFVVPAACVMIAAFVVYAQNRLKLPGTSAATYVATAPLAVSHMVLATGFLVVYMYTPLYGTIWVIALALIASYLCHAIRIAANGLSQIEPALEEAARLNGASTPRVLSRIVAPLIRPSLLSAFILIYVFSLREVNTAVMLYSPTSRVLSVLSWNYMTDGDLASAAVVGLMQIGLMLGGIVLILRLLGSRRLTEVA